MITKLFGVPLYSHMFIRDFNKSEIETFYKILEETRENSKNIISKSSYVLELKEFSEIKQYIQAHLNQFFGPLHGAGRNQDIYITTSWVNLTKPGMSHHHHTHPNSIISGVLYFKCIPNDNIVFTSPFQPLMIQGSKPTMDPDGHIIPVFEKTLILFPSHLRHEVLKNESEEDRISLSFNTYVRGNFTVSNESSDVSSVTIK